MPAWALGTRLTEAFAKYKWCGAIRGVEGGGLVAGLPTHTFHTDEGDIALKCPTEIAITESPRERVERSRLHLAGSLQKYGLCGLLRRGHGQTSRRPIIWTTPTPNARLSATLPYLLAASRFAHYLKVIMRDKIGSFMSRDDVRTFLNTWIVPVCFWPKMMPDRI